MTRVSDHRSSEVAWLTMWRDARTRPRILFEALSVLTVLVVGVWFLVEGWGGFSNTAAITAFIVVGFVGALAVLPLALHERHWLAAIAAAMAAVTPTGFAYFPNLLMLVVLIVEGRLALRRFTRVR